TRTFAASAFKSDATLFTCADARVRLVVLTFREVNGGNDLKIITLVFLIPLNRTLIQHGNDQNRRHDNNDRRYYPGGDLRSAEDPLHDLAEVSRFDFDHCDRVFFE